MSFIDELAAGYIPAEARSLELPEIGRTVYAKVFTVGMAKKAQTAAKGDSVDYLVYAVCIGALDENGVKLFNLADAAKVRTLPETLVAKLAKFVMDMPEDEDIRKNSPTDQDE